MLLDLNLPHLLMRVEAIASHQRSCVLPEARARRIPNGLIRIKSPMICYVHLLNIAAGHIRLLRGYASRNQKALFISWLHFSMYHWIGVFQLIIYLLRNDV